MSETDSVALPPACPQTGACNQKSHHFSIPYLLPYIPAAALHTARVPLGSEVHKHFRTDPQGRTGVNTHPCVDFAGC